MSEQSVRFIAHRGESEDAPENTLAAFRLAWERKVDAIELDVRLTRGGQLVVCHDANAIRTTGADKVIRQSSYEELRGLDAGGWKGSRWRGEHLPTLGEALETIPPDGGCLVEVKDGPEALPALEEAIGASGKRPEQLAVISFYPETIAAARRRLPTLRAYLLSAFRTSETGPPDVSVDQLIAAAKEINAHGLDLCHEGPIDAQLVDRVKSAGLEVYVWTVDSADVAARLIAAGADGITSNRAAALRDELNCPGLVRL